MARKDFIIEGGVLTKYKGKGGDVVIPDGVTSIEDYAFDGYTGLTSITISNGVTSIGNCAFRGCTGLTSITIPDGVTSIGEYVFSDCIGLTSITIPDSVTSIVCGAFDGCKFTTVKYLGTREEWREIKWLDDSEIKEIRCSDGVITREEEEWRSQGFVVEDGVLTYYSDEGGDVVIPDGVTSIGDGAFLFCEGVTSITIPESVTSIEENAFSCCTALDSITYAGTMAEWLSIKKGSNWDLETGDYVIHCTDGDIANIE